jgi:hypothetical protein
MPQYEVGGETMFFLNETRYDEFVSGGGVGPGTVTVEMLAEDSLEALKAVALHDGSTYPTRPLGFVSVEWVGPDPGELAEDGDTWVPTEAPE